MVGIVTTMVSMTMKYNYDDSGAGDDDHVHVGNDDYDD
jgi:hypothetical protein